MVLPSNWWVSKGKNPKGILLPTSVPLYLKPTQHLHCSICLKDLLQKSKRPSQRQSSPVTLHLLWRLGLQSNHDSKSLHQVWCCTACTARTETQWHSNSGFMCRHMLISTVKGGRGEVKTYLLAPHIPHPMWKTCRFGPAGFFSLNPSLGFPPHNQLKKGLVAAASQRLLGHQSILMHTGCGLALVRGRARSWLTHNTKHVHRVDSSLCFNLVSTRLCKTFPTDGPKTDS